MTERPLLMIPGPIEISESVARAAAAPPPGHLSPAVIEAFGLALRRMRDVWLATGDAQPFVLSGSGTLAMEMAAQNVVEPGERAVVAHTGYFSARMAEMLRRRGAEVEVVAAPFGGAPSPEAVGEALGRAGERVKALFVTHVDTSTGVRADAEGMCRVARERGVLSVFDGVCATAAERFEMAAWGADVYLSASQKAIGLPPGLALLVASPRALEARTRMRVPPPLSIDFEAWIPIMRAYEAEQPSYFATPNTSFVQALALGLGEILAASADAPTAMRARFSAHERAGRAMRAAWAALGLELVPQREELAANTLSAIRYPAGVDASLVGRVVAGGVIVAGGLDPEHKGSYFRVGHMGYSATQPEHLERTIAAVGAALGRDAGAVQAAKDAASAELAVR